MFGLQYSPNPLHGFRAPIHNGRHPPDKLTCEKNLMDTSLNRKFCPDYKSAKNFEIFQEIIQHFRLDDQWRLPEIPTTLHD